MDISDGELNKRYATSESSVMAPVTSAPSISIALHPLVIMNISEHWTRVRAQTGKPSKGKKLIKKTKFLN